MLNSSSPRMYGRRAQLAAMRQWIRPTSSCSLRPLQLEGVA